MVVAQKGEIRDVYANFIEEILPLHIKMVAFHEHMKFVLNFVHPLSRHQLHSRNSLGILGEQNFPLLISSVWALHLKAVKTTIAFLHFMSIRYFSMSKCLLIAWYTPNSVLENSALITKLILVVLNVPLILFCRILGTFSSQVSCQPSSRCHFHI